MANTKLIIGIERKRLIIPFFISLLMLIAVIVELPKSVIFEKNYKRKRLNNIVDMDMMHESHWKIRKKETLSGFNLILQHMLSKNFFTSLFEPVINDLSREEARLYIKKFYKFYMREVEVLMYAE